ncbi:RpiR family transcriptional regulator [Paramixta manurensis]|uniref:RpiR family transcriptional regulator n=1 Tax=Paramixta manurensis TaxID=2740817 RepID=A0A6M8U967_9GAMM|nr:RpiR family transcriptional regulator [Erwiniaceae bacterium PD-1]
MNVIEKLEIMKQTGSGAEKTLSAFIMNNLFKIDKLTSINIAKVTQISQPTVVRFSKNLGYSGFAQFKYDLMANAKSIGKQPREKFEIDFSNDINSVIKLNSQSTLAGFFEVVKSSKKIYLCYPRELTNLVMSIIQDFNDIGYLCMPVEYNAAKSIVETALTDSDTFILLPSLKEKVPDEIELLSTIKDAEAASFKVTLDKNENSIADGLLYASTLHSGDMAFIALKMSLQTLFYYTCQYCFLKHLFPGNPTT